MGRVREARQGRGGLGATKPASDFRQSPTERALSVILQGTLEYKSYLRVGPDWGACQSLAKDQRWGCRYPPLSVEVGKAAAASGKAAGVGIGGGGGQSQGALWGSGEAPHSLDYR